jgi:hypothetical protein
MRKFWVLAWLVFLPLSFVSAAEPDIAIGLVQNQFSAEAGSCQVILQLPIVPARSCHLCLEASIF